MASEQPQPDQNAPASLKKVPVIDLPHNWGESDSPLNSSKGCSTCGWDGRFGYMYRHKRVNRSDKPECPFCKVLHRVLDSVPCDRPSPLDSVEIRMHKLRTSVKLHHTGEEILLDIFKPSNVPGSHANEVREIETRDMKRNSTLLGTSLQWAQEQIKTCLDSHQNCRQQSDNQEGFVPTRLIDVSPDGLKGNTIRLRDDTSSLTNSKYTALSYCWGSHRPECITTNDEALKKNKGGLLLEGLPETFRDAVEFTRGLGLKYLWIDSICIIQDDNNDWHREAGKMFEVYRNSYVTLAAVSGENSASGLRHHSMDQDSTLVAEFHTDKGSCPLYMRFYHHLNSPDRPDVTNDSSFRRRHPLLYRAWTFQERLLSPRVVFFTQAEVVFQCLDHIECECGSTVDRSTRANASKHALAYYQDKLRSIEDTQKSNEESIVLLTEKHYRYGEIRGVQEDRSATRLTDKISYQYINPDMFRSNSDMWRRLIVPDYSSLNITNMSDRLLALAAIAKLFHIHRSRERYLAGLWSGSLHLDLLWKRTVGTNELKKTPPFPKWSWASTPGPVEFLQADDKFKELYKATVVDAKCTNGQENPYTILDKSSVMLRLRSNQLSSPLQWETSRLYWGSPNKRWGLDYSVEEREWQWESNGERLRVAHDHELSSEFSESVTLLEVLDCSNNDKRLRYFLILDQLDKSVYTRRGVLVFAYPSGGMIHQDRCAEGALEDSFANFIGENRHEVVCEIR